MRVSNYRDLTLLQIDSNRYFTIACDSCGGIGMSELDIVKVEEEIVGYLTSRVCLIETLAFRAKPTVLINTLCVEMEGRGKRILKGIDRAIKDYNEAQFYNEALEINITGSTEENIPTQQTGIGVTLMGEIQYPFNKREVKKGASIILVGYPKVGQEVLDELNTNFNEIIDFSALKYLTNHSKVIDVLPVGSKGVRYEINELMKTHNKMIHLVDHQTVQLDKSAGPATCVLAVIEEDILKELKEVISHPITLIGEVI